MIIIYDYFYYLFFYVEIVFTLKNCGNVIIPALSCGIIFDILDCLSIYTKDIKNHSYHVISPIAKHSLHYSGILSEW